MQDCEPVTYPLSDDRISFNGLGDMRNVGALTFHVVTDNDEKPPSWTLGGRLVNNADDLSKRNITGIWSYKGAAVNSKGE